MHLVLDIARAEAGRLEGTVRPDDDAPGLPFAGVLELLTVLEALLAGTDPTTAEKER